MLQQSIKVSIIGDLEVRTIVTKTDTGDGLG
jgi:hypothetical protein